VIECIPNISEGRRSGVIQAAATAVRTAPGVRLLDTSSDPAHNRTVLTFAGDAAAVKGAVLALFEVVVAAVDLRVHEGVHPRIGAVDVVPFVPLAGASMDECVALARSTGADVARRFGVPVYLYEAAATVPARKNLANIRHGQFEGLTAKMKDPAWTPDFGPREPHPSAGATAVGARGPLIAYNVNLATDRLDVAKRIAAAVRESGGGLPSVKALGVPLRDRGIVQVSMNLTDYEVTPIATAFNAVRQAAARHGVGVLHSEIVGLVPAAALPDNRGTLLLKGFEPAQILENRLKQLE
jgi:glutamate formiminotransferase